MTDYITDREIERLALGELDETEANELMRKLEERGEIDRLEAIIADDEAFLEAHPPALLASQVRAEVRRRTRENATREPRMINPSRTRFATGIVAGFAAAAVLFAIVYVQFVELEQRAPDEIATMTNNATNTAAPQPVPPPVPEPPPKPQPERPKGQVLRDQGGEFQMPTTLYMSVGDTLKASAEGVTRIAVGTTKVLSAKIEQDAQLLHMNAKEPGQSLLSLTQTREGLENTRSAVVIVGAPLPADIVDRLVRGDYTDPKHPKGPPALSDCAEHSDEVVTLRIVAQHASTFIGHAHAGGKELSPELKRCIDEVAARWQVGYLVPDAPSPRQGSAPYRYPMELSVGSVRFNFATGEQCEADDEDC